MTTRKYGYIPDLGDHRDVIFAAPPYAAPTLPPKWSLRDKMPAVYDQGELGSCVANAISAVYEYERYPYSKTLIMPSRLFLYYNARLLEGTVYQDSGVMVRDGIKALATYGICDESEWPYDTSAFSDKPSEQVYIDAKPHITYQYSRVPQSLTQIKVAIYLGFPVVFGFTVYDSFESKELAQTGIMHLPDASESVLGGHCTDIVGWDDTTNRWEIRNSYGNLWGDQGYFYMPYAYALDSNLADDFWVIKGVR